MLTSIPNLQPLLRRAPPRLARHVGGCTESGITGTTHHTNGNVPEQSVCQSNIYKSNHILKAVEEFTGPKNPARQPFTKGRLLPCSESLPPLVLGAVWTPVLLPLGT